MLSQVDILFEDDKGFWSAMYDIINMSKRPIILTCNGMSCFYSDCVTCDPTDPHLQLECHHNVIDMCRPSEVSVMCLYMCVYMQ